MTETKARARAAEWSKRMDIFVVHDPTGWPVDSFAEYEAATGEECDTFFSGCRIVACYRNGREA